MSWKEYLDIAASFFGVLGALMGGYAYLQSVNTQRQLRKQQEDGIHFDNLKCQHHVLNRTGRGIEVGIRVLAQATLGDVLVGIYMPDTVKKAALAHANTSSVFRMSTSTDQDFLYRDVVSWAGTLLPGDAEPHMLVILCEKADGVERRMLRPVLYTFAQLQMLRDRHHIFTTEVGKDHQSLRIDASKEAADLLAKFDSHAYGPACRDTSGFIIGHLVEPSTAGIARKGSGETHRRHAS